jgi:uncharacterized protein
LDSPPTLLVVLDTNTLVRGVLSRSSASGQIVAACESRRIQLLLSKPVLDEYSRIASSPEIVERASAADTAEVQSFLARLRYLSVRPRLGSIRFRLERDPRDEMFIELAIAGHATHIITHDKDLLSLPNSRTDAGKRFRQRCRGVRVLEALAFVAEHPHLVG